MATNEQVIARIDKLEETFFKELNEVKDMAKKNDEAIRGNGGPGLKSKVSAHETTINEIRWYFRGTLMLFVAQLVAQLLGL